MFRGCLSSHSNEILKIFYRPVDMWIFIFLFLWSSLLGKRPWEECRIRLLHGSGRVCLHRGLRELCPTILQFHEAPVVIVFSCQEGENPICEWLCAEGKSKFTEGPWHSFQPVGNLGWTGFHVNTPEGLSVGQTLLLGSPWPAEVQAWAWWDGEVSCPTCISWGFSEL